MVEFYNNSTELDRLKKAINRWRTEPMTLTETDVIQILQHYLTNQPIQYKVSGSGLEVGLGKGKSQKLHLLTDTLILPYLEIKQHSTKDINHKLQLIGYRNGKMLEPVTLSPSELHNMRWIREAWGFKIWISSLVPNTIQYIQDCINLAR